MRMCVNFKDIASAKGAKLEKITREMTCNQWKNSLLQKIDIEIFKEIIACGDNVNNGIEIDDAICLVSQFSKW